MNHEQYCQRLIESVTKQMDERRLQHTLGVARTAKEIARIFGADVQKAEIAAILHDYCKQWPEKKIRQVIETMSQNSPDLLQYSKEIWHAPASAEIVRQELGIEDEEILNAIRYHTTGRVDMSLLEKVVCLADYIEPGRKYSGLNEIRRQVVYGIDHALIAAFGNTISFLAQRKQKIYPLTFLTYNNLVGKLEKMEGLHKND